MVSVLTHHPQVGHQVVFLQVKIVEGVVLQFLKGANDFLPLVLTLLYFLLPGAPVVCQSSPPFPKANLLNAAPRVQPLRPNRGSLLLLGCCGSLALQGIRGRWSSAGPLCMCRACPAVLWMKSWVVSPKIRALMGFLLDRDAPMIPPVGQLVKS